MSLLDSLADAGKTADAVKMVSKIVVEAAPLIEAAKQLKTSNPEIYKRIVELGDKFKKLHPVASAAASKIETSLIAKLPELTTACQSVADGGNVKTLLTKLGGVEDLVTKLSALK